MSLEWRRLIDITFDSHTPWLLWSSIEQQSQILIAMGTTGWFILAFQLSSIVGGRLPRVGLGILTALVYASLYFFCATEFSFIFSSVAALLPWLLVSHQNIAIAPSVKKLFFLSSGVLAALNSSIFAPLVLGLFLLFSYCSHSKLKYPILSTLIFISACVVYSTAPQLIWPELPAFARFIPDDGLPGLIRPLLGAATPAPILNYQALAQVAITISFAIVFCLIALLGLRREWSKTLEAKLLGLLAVALLLHNSMPASIVESLPIQALGRIIPGWFEQPLAMVLLSVLFSFLLYSVLRGPSSPLMRITIPALLLFSLSMKLPTTESLRTRTISDISWALDSEINPAIRRFQCPDKTLSPVLKNSNFVPIQPFVESITFSRQVAEKNLARVMDRNLKTRWSSKSAGQHGNEWIKIKFQQPLAVEGIELHTGKFRSDFPRGILISDCTTDSKIKLFQDQNWQGALEYTTQGVPFLLNQSNVKVPLCTASKAPKVNCLLIQQTGTNPTFDWSVAEINIALRGEG